MVHKRSENVNRGKTERCITEIIEKKNLTKIKQQETENKKCYNTKYEW